MKSFLSIFCVVLLVGLSAAASNPDFAPEFLEDLESNKCRIIGDKPTLLNAEGRAICFADLECTSSKTGNKYPMTISAGAYGTTACPTLKDWAKRVEWLRGQQIIFSERPKFDEPIATSKAAHSKAISTIQPVEGALNCGFNVPVLKVSWVKQDDGEMKPFCSGSIQCMEKSAGGQWVKPTKAPPAVLGCSPRTKENLRFGEIYCKESVAECWKEREDFPTMPDAPMREDYKWNTLTGKESDASQFVASDKRTLVNPKTSEKEVHVDRTPQSDRPPVESLVQVGQVR